MAPKASADAFRHCAALLQMSSWTLDTLDSAARKDYDGPFPTLLDVVNYWGTVFKLRLTGGESNDLIEYLKSI